MDYFENKAAQEAKIEEWAAKKDIEIKAQAERALDVRREGYARKDAVKQERRDQVAAYDAITVQEWDQRIKAARMKNARDPRISKMQAAKMDARLRAEKATAHG